MVMFFRALLLEQFEFGLRCGCKQRARVVVLGVRSDLLGCADLHDFSAAHHGDAVAQVAHNGHGVRDEEIGEAEVALEFFEQVHDLRADADIERGYRFVTHNEFGPQNQGAGNADALALSSGKFMRVAAESGFVESYGSQDINGGLVQIGGAGQRRGRMTG